MYICYSSHFFLDKDFDYINVIEDLFPGCFVFHTKRYFKDKVFTGKIVVLVARKKLD